MARVVPFTSNLKTGASSLRLQIEQVRAYRDMHVQYSPVQLLHHFKRKGQTSLVMQLNGNILTVVNSKDHRKHLLLLNLLQLREKL
jgi:hypothetical protein